MTTRAELGEALASHTARAAARLRAAGLVTGLLQVSIATSPFREDEPQYHPTWGLALPVPTADTVPLLRAARAALGLIYRAGYRYQRAGVVLLDLSPAGTVTGDLFAPVAPAGAARRARLLEVLDGVNGRWGRGTLRYLAEGGAGGQTWRMRRERLSPGYTTDWGGCRGWGEKKGWSARLGFGVKQFVHGQANIFRNLPQ